MLRHFCLKPVSRNSTATTISMHGIVSLLKPRRALRRGYTPPKRWSRHVEITCGLHHMRLRHIRYPSGHIHAIIGWSALAGPALLECSSWNPVTKIPGESSSKAIHDLTVPTIRTLISSGGSCIAWVFFLEKKCKKLQVNLPPKQYTIQQCQPTLDDAPCKASVKRTRITSHLRTVSLHLCDLVDQLWNCVSSQHLDQCELRQCMTFLCLETSLQCREVMTPYAQAFLPKAGV